MSRKRKSPVKPGDPLIRDIDYTVDDNGCRVWNGSVHRKGYASVQVNGRAQKAHRVAYEMAYGPIPDGKIIRHLCNNPSCVNPEHLRAGTREENARDMVAAGSQSNQIFMMDSATELRVIFSEYDISERQMAEWLGVNPGTIRNIISGKTFPDPSYTPPPKGQRGKRTLNENSAAISKLRALLKQRQLLKVKNGPAPTGKEEQQRRVEELRDPNRKPHRKPGEPLITDNHWELDPETGCHNWKYAKSSTGQARITLEDGSMGLAHRVAWEIHNDRKIPEGFQVNHKCNNATCINPEHLYLGDQSDNMRDTVKAGNHATQKITWDQARAIRAEYEPGKNTHEELAAKYNVSAVAIGDVVNNKTFEDSSYEPTRIEGSVRRKLSMPQATAIREKFKKSMTEKPSRRVSQRALAQEYGVDKAVIAKIICNETYPDPNYVPPHPDDIPDWRLSRNEKASIVSEYLLLTGSEKSRCKVLADKYGVFPNTIKNEIRKAGISDVVS